MGNLQKAIQKNSANLKNKKTSDLLDAVRGGKATEGWVRASWTKSF
ncbi:hypothetical protein M2263_003284 [Providencia alcalifaciens]|nr:hypothetical protein [Providencia alcalifaciens]